MQALSAHPIQACPGGGPSHFVKVMRTSGRTQPSFIKHMLGWISSNYAFSNGGDMKGALLSIEEECYMHMLALCFFYYLHIHTSDKQIIVEHTKMGVDKGVVQIFPTLQPTSLHFWEATTDPMT